MRELIKDEEELTFKAVTLRVENSTLYHRLDYNKEAKLIRQKGEIQGNRKAKK